MYEYDLSIKHNYVNNYAKIIKIHIYYNNFYNFYIFNIIGKNYLK